MSNTIPDGVAPTTPTPTLCSFVARPIFFLTAFSGTVLTGIALFTTGWFEIHPGTTGVKTYGIMIHNQEDWWNEQPNWEKTVMVLMILAFAIEIIVVIWVMLNFISVCIPSLFVPVPFLTGIAAILLVICVALYSVYIQKEIESITIPSLSFINLKKEEALDANVGYSFWLAVVAMAIMIFATFLGCVATATTATN